MKDTTTTQTPPKSAEQLIQDVRRRTRRRFSAEEKIRIVIEGLKREMPVSDLCRQEGIPSAIYYSWLKDFMEAGKARLRGDVVRSATTEDVGHLRRENDRLKTIVADQMLEVTLLKKSLIS